MSKNKKIGILTFHYKDNFGAVLQCFALQKFLKNEGFDVEVINFKPKSGPLRKVASIIKNHLLFILDNFNILNVNIYLKQFFSLFVQTLSFNFFRNNYLNLSELYDANKTNHNLNKYDILITGSDQIWNSIEGYYNAYFLIPFTSFDGKRFSYAACRGIEEINKNDVSLLKIALEKYDWIGVRDHQTQEFVHTISNQNADVVCDPSMLINYKDLISPVSPLNFKYIFVYILGEEINGNHLNVIQNIKKSVGNFKVVAAYLTHKNPNYFEWADVHLYDSSPIEWVNLINYAEYLYTDSFHGVLFAIKFEKRVLAFYAEKKRASRLLDIAERLELSNYIVSSFDEAIEKDSFNTIIDYENYKLLEEKFINKSKKRFLSILNQ